MADEDLTNRRKKGGKEGMLTAQGIGVFADIVIGQLVFYERQIFKVHKEQVRGHHQRNDAFREAKEQAVRQVHILHQTALREVSQENAAIFQAHHMLLEDMDFNGYVLDVIQNRHSGCRICSKSGS